MLQRALVWVLAVVAFALTLFGIVHERLWTATGWSPAGALSLAWYLILFSGVSAALLLWKPQWYGASVAVLGGVYSVVTAGPLAVGAVLYLSLSAYCLGRIVLPRPTKPDSTSHILTLLTGYLLWMLWFLFTLALPIHYWYVYAVLLAVPIYCNFHFGLFPLLSAPRGAVERTRAWPVALLWMPLLAVWLLTLKPEASSDGLARHLVFAARLAADHFWRYDVQRFTWAVAPMGGESLFGLAYLLGGEMAARLLNFSLLVMACWMLYARLHRRVPAWVAASLTGGFVAAPIAVSRTANLALENWTLVYALGAVLLLRMHKKEGRHMYAYASSAFAGAACACNVAGLAFLIPFYVGFAAMTSSSAWMPGAAIALIIAAVPYLNALLQTANPVFPYFNNFFRSQFFDTARAVPLTPFHEPLSWRSLYDMTFRGSRFSFGAGASFGFTTFLLLPFALASSKKRWPRTGFVLMGTIVPALLVLLLVMPDLAQLYMLIPLVVLLTGMAIGSHRLHSPGLGRTLGWLAFAAYALNIAFLPSASREHDDFIPLPFSKSAIDNYLATHAAERPLVARLAQARTSATTAFLESANVGDYRGRVYTNTWHTPAFPKRLAEATNADSLYLFARDLKLDYYITTAETATQHKRVIVEPEFLARYAHLEARFGDAELYRFTPPALGALPPDLGWAKPGVHDELDPAVHFEGAWTRETNEPRALRSTYIHTNDLRSRVEIRFEGRAIRLLHSAAANRCLATVSFGYDTPRDWDQFAERTAWRVESPRFEAPTPGLNTLVVHIATPDKSLANLGACHLDLDGFIVE